jgi:hypothetical protein
LIGVRFIASTLGIGKEFEPIVHDLRLEIQADIQRCNARQAVVIAEKLSCESLSPML